MITRTPFLFLAPQAPVSSLIGFAASHVDGDLSGDRYAGGSGSGLSDLTRPAPGKVTLTSRLHPLAASPAPQTSMTPSPLTVPAAAPLAPHDDPFGLHLLGSAPATAQATAAPLIAASDVDFGEVVAGGQYRQPLHFYNTHPSAPAYVTVSMASSPLDQSQEFVLIPPKSGDAQWRRPSGEERLTPMVIADRFYHLLWRPSRPGALSVPITISLSWQDPNVAPQTKTIVVRGTSYVGEKPSAIAAREAQEEEAERIRDEETRRSAGLDRRVKRDNERDVVYPAGALRELSAAYERAQDALTLLTEKQAIGARVAGEEAGRFRKKMKPQSPEEAATMAEFVLNAANKGLSRYARKLVESALGGGPMVAITATLVSEIVANAGNRLIKRAVSQAEGPDRDNSDIYFFANLEALLRDSDYARQNELQRTFDQLQTMTPKRREDAVSAMAAIADALHETSLAAVKEQADQARYAWMRELALRELGTDGDKRDADGRPVAAVANAIWYRKEETAPGINGVLDLTVVTDRHHKSGVTIASARMNGVIDEMAAVLAEKPLSELRRLGVVIRVTVKDPSLADSLGYVVVDRDQIVYLDKTGTPFRPESPYPANWLAYFSTEDRGTPLEERQNQGARELMAFIGTRTLGKLGIPVTTDHDRKSR